MYPARHSAAVLQSVLAHSHQRVEVDPPGSLEFADAEERILSTYPYTEPPLCFREGFNDKEIVSETIRILESDINPSANPGVPLTQLARMNEELIESHGPMVLAATVTRLRKMKDFLEENPDPDTWSPDVNYVIGGLVDPVRFMIKKEPHPPRKIQSGKYRLISVVSIVDQVIDRLLCKTQNQTEIANWLDCPSSPGISLQDRGLAAFANKVFSYQTEIASNDVSGWDWSVQAHEHVWEAEMRWKLMGSPQGPLRGLLRLRAHLVINSVFCLPNGRLFKLYKPGIMLSGLYCTSSSNSRIRVRLAHLVGSNWARAMGDDCVAEPIPDAANRYALYGRKVRDQVKSADTFGYCSRTFRRGELAYPETIAKTVFNYCNGQLLPEQFPQLAMEIRHFKGKDKVLAAIKSWQRARQNDQGKSREEGGHQDNSFGGSYEEEEETQESRLPPGSETAF